MSLSLLVKWVAIVVAAVVVLAALLTLVSRLLGALRAPSPAATRRLPK